MPELVVANNDKELTSAVNKIRKSEGGNICILGGVRTAQNFSRLDMIDEFILMMHPVAIAKGKPLFISKERLEFVSTKSYNSGVIQMRYRPAKRVKSTSQSNLASGRSKRFRQR